MKQNTFPNLSKKILIDKVAESKNKTFEKELFTLMTLLYCKDKQHLPTQTLQAFIAIKDEKFLSDNTAFLAWLKGKKRLLNKPICTECLEMILETFQHTDRCKHSYYKTFCHRCPTPCYSKTWQIKMKPVMAYGKKLIFSHPVMAYKFMTQIKKSNHLIKKYQKENLDEIQSE